MKINRIFLYTALACLALGCGCSKEPEKQPEKEPDGPVAKPDPYDTRYARMHDPEYLKAIKEKRVEQQAVMKALGLAKAELDAFKEKNPGAAVPEELKKKYTDALVRMEKNRLEAEALVRERIQQENRAIEAREKREGESERGVKGDLGNK